jgi:hypothetical protein
MKKIFTLTVLAVALLTKSRAQFQESFDNNLASLTSNCWSFTNIFLTNTPGEVITGTGSLYSTTAVNASGNGEFTTPALNANVTSFGVSFNYKISNNLAGQATRTVTVGLLDAAGSFTTLASFVLDKNTPTAMQSFNQSFELATLGLRKLAIRWQGTNGDGNTRLIFDDVKTTASAAYGPVNFCNSAPVAANDVFNITNLATTSGTVIANDNDPNGESLTASIVSTTGAGSLTLNPNGSFLFIPNPLFTGSSTTFTYKVCDNGFDPLCSNTATVTFNFLSAIVLPVKLMNFQGAYNNNKISLQWADAENETADHFEIERSINGRDFTTVGIVMTTEKAGAESYAFNETVSAEKLFYRLKMFDKNQQAQYSKILVFQSKVVLGNNNLKIINNPVQDKLTLSFASSANQAVEIHVYDLAGRLQMVQKAHVYAGSNTISLSLNSAFIPGMYLVDLTSETGKQSAKFIKQ